MLIESRLDGSVLYIDAEASSGIDKSSISGDFDHDQILENVVGLIGRVSQKLAEAAATASVAMLVPSSVEVNFGVRVDGNSIVSIARVTKDAQFQVRVAWSPSR